MIWPRFYRLHIQKPQLIFGNACLSIDNFIFHLIGDLVEQMCKLHSSATYYHAHIIIYANDRVRIDFKSI